MSQQPDHILFTHSGGPTAVINAIAATIAEMADNERELYIAKNGVDGLIQQHMIHASDISPEEWRRIKNSPASSFGSSRLQLPKVDDHDFYQPLFKYLDQYDIHTFFCNGGNNSQHITLQMYQAAKNMGYDLKCVGIPKTIDNDILHTDTCPGFGSAAKYTATSVYEISLDIASVCDSSTQVLIYETMGRHAGWLAASTALAKQSPDQGPHIILLPEAKFSIKQLLQAIKTCIKQYRHCVICIAEGATDIDQQLSNIRQNAPGQPLLGMVAPQLGQIIENELATRNHIIIPDYLQRSARHISSLTDLEQSVALAQSAYQLAKSGQTGIMVNIVRESNAPYKWSTGQVALEDVAGKERLLPKDFIREDQLFVTEECIAYIQPLILGEAIVPFVNGIPDYSNHIYQVNQSIGLSYDSNKRATDT